MSIQLTNWEFRSISNHLESPLEINKWYQTSPNSNSHQIHVDLLYNELIPDPFIDDYEKTKVQWISELNWQYRCCLFYNNDDDGDVVVPDLNESMMLIFEGIDTFATIQLNNETILSTDNAFQKHIVPINLFDTNNNNELIITYESSLIRGKILEDEFGSKPVWNGDSSRVYVRKPQYQYGWDWGPVLNTFGFESVKLINDINYIDDFFVRYKLNHELDKVDLFFELLFLFDIPNSRDVTIDIKDDLGNLVKVIKTQSGEKLIKLQYSISDVKLWYPIHHGNQLLYTFDVLIQGKLKLSKKIGFRKVELIQSPDKLGQTFYFKINNIPIQIFGTNWIPAHSFTSKLTNDDYSQWLDLVVYGGYNLIRIWGGGQYENKKLYELCDEFGIMIWQDFMFACGIYPNIILDSVKKEISDQLVKLRQYCSIIIYAGNNEDYQIAEVEKLVTNNSTEFPAKIIYEDIIPIHIKNLCNQTPYQFGSPYSNSIYKSSNTTIGDLHQWNVWHGDHQPYQNWPDLSGRFISEFGMLSYPSMTTLKKYINESELYPNSTLLNFHTRASGAEYLEVYVWDNLPKPQKQQQEQLTLESWIYFTQLMQSEALSFAYRYWRRNWQDYKTGGIIVWQLNDCWPSISWSTIDFLKIPKLSYYGIKREIQQTMIGCFRKKMNIESKYNNNYDDDDQKTFNSGYGLDIWGFGNNENLTLEIQFFNEFGELYFTETINNLTLINYNNKNNNYTIIHDHYYPQLHDTTIIYLRLFQDNQVIARSSDWPQPLKKLSWNKLMGSSPIIEYLGNNKFKLSTPTKPTKGLELYFNDENNNNNSGDNYLFSDNGIDLFPNDDQIIEVFNFNEVDISKINYRHLGSIITDSL